MLALANCGLLDLDATVSCEPAAYWRAVVERPLSLSLSLSLSVEGSVPKLRVRGNLTAVKSIRLRQCESVSARPSSMGGIWIGGFVAVAFCRPVGEFYKRGCRS
jgi:hypothetical protein